MLTNMIKLRLYASIDQATTKNMKRQTINSKETISRHITNM